ncbi:mucin-binding protein [Fructobacillus americanaquae]|uniref:MucBP domain-containing protein n=1 Tax=Fructobacillus americanaquae TaxID=2940302 RepID=A0ABY5C1L9_9LACO|nr:MucBP domain-containing protein [Fructobacillus americanaquae]USS91979.1 MucBP domain-containing protein [Fructobacillus americanaquae]
MEQKIEHYKMYKSGKKLVYASIVVFSLFATSGSLANQEKVSADTTPSSSTASVDATKSDDTLVRSGQTSADSSNLSGLQISISNEAQTLAAGNTLNLTVNVSFNSLATSVKAGDKITLTIPNNLVNWDAVTTTGGNQYGTFSHDASSNTLTFTFSKNFENQVGSFGFGVHAPIKSDAPDTSDNVITSTFVASDGKSLTIPVSYAKFSTGAVPPAQPLPAGTNRMQAPGTGVGNNDHKYSGDDITTNDAVSHWPEVFSNQINQDGKTITTNVMSLYDILQPDQDNSKSLTGRKYLFKVSGPDASIDYNSFRFKLPKNGTTTAGQGWGTLSQIQNGDVDGQAHPGFILVPLSSTEAQLIIPDGMNIQNMTVFFNLIAPDYQGTYTYDQPYTDNQGTGSWDVSYKMTWQNPHDYFAAVPVLSVPQSKFAMTTDNIPDVNAWLKSDVTASVTTDSGNVDLTKDIQILNDGGATAAWNNKQPGTYTVSYQVVYQTTDSTGKTLYSMAKATGSVTIASPSSPNVQQGRVIVRYTDENNQEIAGMPEKKLIGLTGTVYTVDTPSIKGYHYQKADAALVGAFGTSDQPTTITLSYAKDAPTVTNETKTVNETVHYQYADGGQAAADYVATPVTLTRTVSTDAVTGEKTYGNWTADQSFPAVTSPALKGYTANQPEIAAQTVDGDSKDLDFIVTYTKNAPAESTDTKTVNETIHYQYADGSKAADDYVATPIIFTRSVSTDAVTGEKIYGNWIANQSFAAVTSPTLQGYTADQTSIAAQNVTPDSSDLVYTVKYTKDEPKGTTTTDSHDGNVVGQNQIDKVVNPQADTNHVLPNTGLRSERSQSNTNLLFALFASFAGLGIFSRRKKNK